MKTPVRDAGEILVFAARRHGQTLTNIQVFLIACFQKVQLVINENCQYF